MTNTKTIAIIPARGGSKRIPQKNIRPFNGKPLIAWTIEAALAAQLFDHVFVSTDCSNIAQVAKSYGAEVPFLRDETHDDLSTASEATIYTLQKMEQQLRTRCEVVVQLMATCPLRNSKDIRDAFYIFTKKNAELQVSYYEPPFSTIWWAASITEDNRPQTVFPDVLQKRSQDLEHLVVPTGAIWIAQRSALLESGSFHGPKTEAHVIPSLSGLDIDTELEFAVAEQLLKLQKPVD